MEHKAYATVWSTLRAELVILCFEVFLRKCTSYSQRQIVFILGCVRERRLSGDLREPVPYPQEKRYQLFLNPMSEKNSLIRWRDITPGTGGL